jgi:hypothetical protein
MAIVASPQAAIDASTAVLGNETEAEFTRKIECSA